jgi:large subunit ribosomal protein L32
MPNPKWRHSKRRKRARRTHDKAAMPQIATCPTTGERHMFHRAFKALSGDIYYRGQILIPGNTTESAEA